MSAVLFYTVGLPGAGKTTFAASLSAWCGAPHLRGDLIGLQLFRFPTFSPEQRRAVYAEMNRRVAENLQKGRHIIYDAAVNTRAQREQLASLAQQYNATAVGIFVEVPTPLAQKRAATLRDASIVGPVARLIPPEIFAKYAAAFEVPTHTEPVVRVRGDAPFALQYRRLQRQLRAHGIQLPRFI